MTKNRSIFVNLPVRNLDRSIEFFTSLGFEFNPEFTNEVATCMIIDENIFAMLLADSFFSDFIPGRRIADTSDTTEVLVALFLNDRGEVDEMIRNAVKAGGTTFREIEEFQGMYGGAFQDLDGHIWEIGHMGKAATSAAAEGNGDESR